MRFTRIWIAVSVLGLAAAGLAQAPRAQAAPCPAPNTTPWAGEVPYLTAVIAASGDPAPVCVPDDALWSSPTANSTVVLQVEYAGNAAGNAFGIYNPNNLGLLQLFSGPQSAGASVQVAITNSGGSLTITNLTTSQSLMIAGTTFGFYLDPAAGASFYSQPGFNPANGDNMATVRTGSFGNYSYWLGWDDKAVNDPGQYDGDYNDMIVRITGSIHPVPLPAAAWLLLSGLAGFGAVARRKRAA